VQLTVQLFGSNEHCSVYSWKQLETAMKKTSKFKNQTVVIIKEQPVKGGGIKAADKNECSNIVYEF
tara:strand:+ start:247 stop:444 length:198 start_codon:yes stop_codon:yes gene_type:complete